MTEAELDREVRRLLKKYDVYGYHTFDSRKSKPGFPDWTIIGRRVLFRELKKIGGRLTSEQSCVRYLLIAARQDFAIWTPTDLESGQIEGELRAIALELPAA